MCGIFFSGKALRSEVRRIKIPPCRDSGFTLASRKTASASQRLDFCRNHAAKHLVGAKLNLLLDSPLQHHGANVADDVSGREGDFIVEDVAIHVTTSPSEALIRKCRRNLDNGMKPVIITTYRGALLAEGLAEQADMADRLDVFEAEQFIAGNLYEIGKFAQAGRRTTAEQLISEYNAIVDECETDPSLKIDVAR